MTLIERDADKVQTSYLTYDLTLLGIENNDGKVEKTSTILNELKADLTKVMNLIDTHCMGYRKFYTPWLSSYCTDCPPKKKEKCLCSCFICTEQRLALMKREEEIAKASHDHYIRQTIKKRSALVQSSWNYKTKDRKCGINFHFPGTSSPFFYLFGTIAIGANLPVSSPFWSSRIRLSLLGHDYVASADNFPMHRVKASYTAALDDKNQITFINENIDVHPDNANESFISYTFLNKLPDIAKQNGGRAKYLLRLTNYLLGSKGKPAKLAAELEKANINYERIALSFFLTYSTSYPFVIKSTFANMADLSSFIQILDENPLFGSFNTIIGYNDSKLFCGDAIGSRSSSGTMFQLLIRGRHRTTGLAKEVISSIDSSFKADDATVSIVDVNLKNQSGNNIRNQWYERPYYWDIVILLKTNATSKLVDYMLRDINNLEGVLKAALMPIYNAIEQKKTTTEIIPQPNDGDRNTQKENESNFKVFEEAWGQGLEAFPKYNYVLEQTANRLCDDQYLLRWSHLRQETRWLISYTGQIEKEWTMQANQSNTEKKDKGILTFIGVLTNLKNILGDILKQDQIIMEFQAVTDEAIRTTKFLQWPFWKKLHSLSEKINKIKDYLISIRSEFNTKIEAQQMINLTGPLKTAGDPAGITDLTIEAARRLFKHYCSGPAKDSMVWGDGGKKHYRREWNGIVTTTKAKDFQLVLPLQLLFLPIDMKFKTQGKFLILAHEAAHQILYWAEWTKRLNEEDTNGQKSAWTSFEEDVWVELAELMDAWIEKLKRTKKRGEKSGFIAAIAKDVGKYKNLPNKFYSLEFLCDIVALLCAGPAYIRPLFSIVYTPRNISNVSSNGSTIHPPMWLRITILLYICHDLDWIKLYWDDNDLSNEEKQKEVDDFNFRHDTFGLYNLAKHHFQKYERWKDKDLWNHLRNVDSLINDLDSLEWRYEIALLGLIADPDFDSKIFFKKLILWTQKHSDNFLYYPLPGIDIHSKPEDIGNAWKDYDSNIRIVDQYVKYLSEKMVYNNEIILNAPLKYISAAMCLPEVTHPQYSTGKIMHSLCYAYDSDGQEIFDLNNW